MAQLLGTPLFPWQQYVVDVALEVLPDGSWAYDEVDVTAQRRSGKTKLIEPVTAHRCGQDRKLSTWITAQRRMNAVSRWSDVATALHTGPLRKRLRKKIGAGAEALTWPATGSTFRPFAPNEDAMHGEDPDLVWVDELWAFTLEQRRLIEQGYKPAWSVKSGQAWLMSTRGTDASEWLNLVCERGRQAVTEGRTSGIAYFEWSLPDEIGGVPLAELDDDALVAAAFDHHPRRDHGLRFSYLETELESLGRGEFLRAYGNRTQQRGADHVFKADAWTRARTSERIPAEARVGIAFEVDPDGRESTVSAAWRGPGGVALTECLRRFDGTIGVAEYVAGVVGRHDVGAVAVNNAGPARDVADKLEQPAEQGGFGVELLRVTAGDYGAARSRFADELTAAGGPLVMHAGDDELTQAMRAATLRQLGAGRVWAPAGVAPITWLVSHTLAVWAADHLPEPVTRFGWDAY